MLNRSGLVLDLYDDNRGELLRGIFPDPEAVPARVKEATALGREERDRLPDDVFALVLVGEGQKLRKFACYDAGNTILSTEYFLKTASQLPLEAQKIAAQNLCEARTSYGLEPAAGLQKLALGLQTALTMMTAPSVIKGTHQQIKGNLAAVRGLEGPGHNIVTPAEIRKVAELTGTGLMPLSAPASIDAKPKAVIKKTASSDAGLHGERGEQLGTTPNIDAKPKAVINKTAAHHLVEGHKPRHLVAGHGGEHDDTLHNGDGIKGERPAAHPQAKQVHFVLTKEQTFCPEEKKASTYALEGRFPLDSLTQIKAAAAYFGEYGKRFAPEDRRTFCVALVKKARALGMPLSDEVRKYGGPSYAPPTEMKIARDLRRNQLDDGPRRQVLDLLFEKHAEIAPDLFCETLAELDKIAGLDFLYDRAVPDPYWSTYGMEKAAEDFSEVIGNDMVTEEGLRTLARTNAKLIKHTFQAEFLKEFQKDPVGIFKSLPRDQKILIMRMATDTAPGVELVH